MAPVPATPHGNFLREGRIRFFDPLAPLMTPVDNVKPAWYNPNNGDVEMIAASIEKYGMYRPIQVQRSTGDVVIGNHTYLACVELGAQRIPVVYLDIDDITARAMMIEDNEIARRAIADRSGLLDLLGQIKDETGDYLLSITEHDRDVLHHLEEMPLSYDEYAQWPTFTVQLPPHLLKALYDYTHEADTDADRIELLLRLAGWDG